MRKQQIFERLGLDCLIFLAGRLPLEDDPLPYPATLSEIREKFEDLEGEKLDEALTYCGDLLKGEDDRSDKIESKAFTQELMHNKS